MAIKIIKINFTIAKSFIIDNERAKEHYQEYVNSCQEHKEYVLSFHSWLNDVLDDSMLLILPDWVEENDSDFDWEEYNEEDE